MPILSVIIPVYNVAPYLRACLDSVCAAVAEMEKVGGEKRWTKEGRFLAEVICVDDGSTDGSGEILDEYVERVNSSSCEFEREGVVGEENDKASAVHLHLISPPVFRVLHQKNAGVSVARNVALDMATGKWVMMIDGDDTWSSDLLLKLFAEVKRYPRCDAVCFGNVKVDEHGNECGMIGASNVDAAVMSGDEILMDGRGPYSKFCWCVWDKMYRRSVLDSIKLRFVEGMRLSEDTLFSIIYLAYAHQVVLRPDIVGYRYLMRGGSAIHVQQAELPDQPFCIFETLYAHWQKLKTPGLRLRLYYMATGLPSLGKGADYAPSVRTKAIELLLSAETFNRRVMLFVLRYGGVKARVFAIAYLLCPRFLRRKLLECL